MHQIRQKKPKPSKRKWINDERRAVRRATSGAIVDWWARLSDAHRSSIAPLVGAVRSSDERRDSSIDERCTSDERDRRSRLSIDDCAARSHRSRCSIIDRAARRRGAIVERAVRSGLSLLSLSLWSGLSLLSLSLSLFPEVIWSENEGRNWFPGQRWKYWSTRSHFPENDIFRDSQTCGKGWKWFPEIIFIQNKRTLSDKILHH